MLQLNKSVSVKGITCYEDDQDPSLYYYLPYEKARIADNGKKIHFVAYIDGEIMEGTDPEFNDDVERSGGFLTLEVELGPNEDEIRELQEDLNSVAGREVRLTQVPFIDGSVRLNLFGSSGSSTGNDAVNVTIAGTTKPSLYGVQTAVFSVRLGGMEAEIMWNLLNGETQTQAAVIYDLEYLGLMPAYHLEITVDFKATEDFWQHHIDADFNMGSSRDGENRDSSFKIASNNDIDIMMRDLVNKGAITIKEIDYTGGGDGSFLGSEDPDVMKLVKDLLSPTLFDASAIPREDYNVLASTIPSDTGGTNPGGTPGSGTSRPTPSNPTRTPTSPTPTTPTPTPTTGSPGSGPGSANPRPPVTPTPTVTATGGSTSPTRPPVPPSNDGEERTDPPPTTEAPPRIDTPTPTSPTPTTQIPTREPTTPPPPTSTSPITRPPTREPTPTPEPPQKETPDKIQSDVSINAGYTLRHRSISQQVKRTFVFDKIEAKKTVIHPQGMLTLEGTAFDKEKQLMLVRLGEGPFKEITIEMRSALDFDAFQIQEAIIHLSYGFTNTNGDKNNRLHFGSYSLRPDNPRTAIKFAVDKFGTLTYDYYVEFIHKAGSIIGSNETKIRSRSFENVSERDIAINISDHSPLIPVTIQTGNIQFSNEGVQSVQVYLAPSKTGTGHTSIFKEGSTDKEQYLIFPEEEKKYVYYKKEKFFFAEDELEQEADSQVDNQVIVNRPDTRVLTISPILVNPGNLIAKAIMKVKFTNMEGEVFEKGLVLQAGDTTVHQQSFTILVAEDDPRLWSATTQFILTNGETIDGQERDYHIEQPPIGLALAGLKVLHISTLNGAETFTNNIAAIRVQIFANEAGENTLGTILLNKARPEQSIVLKDAGADDPISATATLIKKDGTETTENYVIPVGLDQLLIKAIEI